MKKLMITAAAVAMTAGAFASPLVYDYKASVKHMYLKEVKVTVQKQSLTIYQKYQKSASLKGYLILDADGVTSKRVNAASTAQCLDLGRNRGFLVVQNASAEKAVRAPKCLPAILDAKYFDTKFTKKATSGLAEGYLFVGGDTVQAVRPQIDDLNGTLTLGAVMPAPSAATAGGIAYADYAWQSIYLFGQFNGPNWFAKQNPGSTGAAARTAPFAGFEAAWDTNLPAILQRAPDAASGAVDVIVAAPAEAAGDSTEAGKAFVWNYFHDTWMNGSGIGKYFVPSPTTDGELCCGLTPTKTTYVPTLESLSGNLKGGIFLCTENGVDANDPEYMFWDYSGLPTDYDWSRWDDQFVANRLVTLAGDTQTWTADAWQNDVWLDGAVDQAATDVCYGTWSIKINKKFFAKNGPYATYAEASIKYDASTKEALKHNLAVAPSHAAAFEGVDELFYSILAAGWNLNKNAILVDGDEIYTKTAGARFKVPMLTPKFCTYYGLNNWL